jgi:hypothetical protein
MADLEVTIQIENPEFFKALEDPTGFLPYLGIAMQEILSIYQEVAEVYAPESEANSPGRLDKEGKPMGYYERGRGWWYPVITHNKMGLGQELPLLRPHSKSPRTMRATTLMAEGFAGVAGYKLIANSEQMHDRWSNEVHITVDGVVGNLRNTATYAEDVQGKEQAPLHASRGWRTVESSWEDSLVQDSIIKATNKALDDYYGKGGR